MNRIRLPDAALPGTTGGWGYAAFTIAIPDDPALRGARGFAQAATLRPDGLKVSNAVAIIIG